MINNIEKDAKMRMNKGIDALQTALSKLRAGRANPSLLEEIKVSYYGQDTSLNQLANINVADARTLNIIPWEKNLIPEVEKAILKADLGLNPSSSSDMVRVPFPPLTEERRKDLVKMVRGEGENAKVGVRNIRRDANTKLKDLLKDKSISEDDEHHGQDLIQKMTDKFVAQIDKILAAKEKDLMAL